MKLADHPVRTVLLIDLHGDAEEREAEEQRRARNRKNVKAWRERNRARWNAIQTRSRDRRRTEPKRVYRPRADKRSTSKNEASA